MEPAEKLSIALLANLARIVREKVESGAYASNREVISVALMVLLESVPGRAQRLAQIRQDISEAIDDPRASSPV